MSPLRWHRLRRYLPAIVLFTLVVVIAWLFHHVLIPFLVALFIVYLMEPVVSALSGVEIKGRLIPRWGAVALVYTVFLGTVSLFLILFLPAFAKEVTNLANEAPRFFTQLRDERIPAWSDRVDRLLETFYPDELEGRALGGARAHVHDAIERADLQASLVSTLPHDERSSVADAPVTISRSSGGEPPVLVRIRQSADGELEVLAGDRDVRLVETHNGYAIRSAEGEADAPARASPLDLERSLTQSFNRLVEISDEGIANAIDFGQRLVGGVLSALLTILVTLMVAAFVSIDVPSIMRMVRGLFPPESQDALEELIGDLDRGLSGVVRGQLLICLVNGVLTGIGLFLLDVKFALIIAVVAGVLSLIPIFGTIISTIPAVAMGLTSGLMTGALVLLWILGIHFLEANFLNPKIIGTAARIHPAIVIFALIAGEHSFGLIGALLAVPCASMVQTFFLFFRDRFADGQSPPEPSEAHERPL